MSFRDEYYLLVYLVNFSGLYFKSIDCITKRKWLKFFLTIWTKFSITLLPIYLCSTIPCVFLKETHIKRMALIRQIIVFSAFFIKNIYFYLSRSHLERLIDIWDASFNEEFYMENRREKLRNCYKFSLKILSLTWSLPCLAAMLYVVPPFFSSTKILSHPTIISYRKQFPDYYLMALFDFFSITTGCLSSTSFDCILIVFLFLACTQLSHLKNSLLTMVKEIGIDCKGNIFLECQDRVQGMKEDIDSFVEIDTSRRQIKFLSTNKKSESIFYWKPRNHLVYEKHINKFEIKMRIWILHHQQCIRFFEEMKNLFAPVVSIHLVFVVLYTCFTALHLAKAKIEMVFLVIPVVTSSSLISLFVWCKLGNMLHYFSSALFEDAFGQAWFLYPKKIKTAFSMIIMRGNMPLSLKGLSIFKINLVLFSQILQFAYQLSAFMMNMSTDND